jgi:hypothetical protein
MGSVRYDIANHKGGQHGSPNGHDPFVEQDVDNINEMSRA